MLRAIHDRSVVQVKTDIGCCSIIDFNCVCNWIYPINSDLVLKRGKEGFYGWMMWMMDNVKEEVI